MEQAQVEIRSENDRSVISQSKPFRIGSRTEIDFGTHYVNDSYVVFPGRCQLKHLIQFE